jgi:hypothetical protein
MTQYSDDSSVRNAAGQALSNLQSLLGTSATQTQASI